MLLEFLSMLEDSREDTGHCQGLDPRRNGTEPMSTNLMENWRKMLEAWCSTLPKAVILCFVPAAPWKEENWKAKAKEWNPFASTSVMTPLNWFFAQLFPSISSVCTEQYQMCVKNYPETHEVQGNPPRMRIWNQWWYRQNFLLLTLYLSDWRGCTRKPVSRIRPEIRRTSWTTTIDQTLLQCWFLEEYWQRTMLDYTWWGRTWRYENIMSRVHLTSKKRHIPRERVDSWKHEQGRYGVEILIESFFRDRTVSWVRIVNGINKYVTETSQEIPVASVEKRGTGETCREGYTTTKADVNIVSCVYSLSWTKMDRRWSRKIQPRLF